MSKLQNIQLLLLEYQKQIDTVSKKEILDVLVELCTYCGTLEAECIKLLQNRNSITTTQETPFSWESLRKENSPFKCQSYQQ